MSQQKLLFQLIIRRLRLKNKRNFTMMYVLKMELNFRFFPDLLALIISIIIQFQY